MLRTEASVVEQEDEAGATLGLAVQLEPERGERLLYLRDRIEVPGVGLSALGGV